MLVGNWLLLLLFECLVSLCLVVGCFNAALLVVAFWCYVCFDCRCWLDIGWLIVLA